MPRAGEAEMASGASALPDDDPVASAYRLLDDAVSRYGLRDAWLVVHPRGRSAQIFRHGRRPTDGADVRRLAARPTGLYGDPAIDPVAGALLGASYEATFTAQHAAADAMVDPRTGLLTKRAIDRSLARAAASAARHRWSTTAVLVTTAGAGEAERWPALAAALGEALRSGDEAGTAEPGTGLALLGNAGADAVRPFLARVRAALSAAGWEDADLLAGAATTPQESVDPAELWRLASERLAALGADPPAMGSASPLELELRELPAVACVGLHQNGSGPGVTVVRLGPTAAGHDIEATVRRHDPDLAVHVVTADTPSVTTTGAGGGVGPDPHAGGDGEAADDSLTPFDPSSPPPLPPSPSPPPETGPPAAPTATAMPHDRLPGGEPALARSAAAPGTGGDTEHAPRATLIDASFDPSRGMSEVTLALGPIHQTGRAPAGALIGGAQATLVALGALGRSIPFYLVSAERVRTIPGEPVVVVLAPRDDAGPAGDRIGVAGGTTDVGAASKAVLAALNRFLAGSPSGA